MKRSLLLFFIPFIIFTWIVIGPSQKACNNIMQADATKKIPFSHKNHIQYWGVTDCTTCHGYYEDGRFKGLPSVAECTQCHDRNGSLTGTDHTTPRKKTVFDSYKDTDRPWTAWAKQPDLVYFSQIGRASCRERV